MADLRDGGRCDRCGEHTWAVTKPWPGRWRCWACRPWRPSRITVRITDAGEPEPADWVRWTYPRGGVLIEAISTSWGEAERAVRPARPDDGITAYSPFIGTATSPGLRPS